MKRIIFGLTLLLGSQAFAGTPARLVGDKIQFAVGKINGKDYFSQSEFNAVVATDSGSITSVSYTPTAFELGVANSGIVFENYSDFEECINNKNHLNDKILDIKPSVAQKKQAELTYIETENAKKP